MTSLMSHTLSLDVIEMFAQDASHVSEVLVPHVGPGLRHTVCAQAVVCLTGVDSSHCFRQPAQMGSV